MAQLADYVDVCESARADLKVGVTTRVSMRTAQEVAQKNEGQADYTQQGHARPDIKQKAGRTGVKQSVQQLGKRAWWNAGEHLRGD